MWPHSGGSDLRGALHDEHVEGLCLALELERTALERGRVKLRRGGGIHADQDLARRGRRGQAGGGVHGVAERSEIVELPLLADASKERHTAVDGDAGGDPRVRGMPVPATMARAALSAAPV